MAQDARSGAKASTHSASVESVQSPLNSIPRWLTFDVTAKDCQLDHGVISGCTIVVENSVWSLRIAAQVDRTGCRKQSSAQGEEDRGPHIV